VKSLSHTIEPRRSECSTLAVVLLIAATTFAAPAVSVTLKHNSEHEQQTKAELERLLASYDLSKYTFTHEVIIDENAIPHSNPVLTLHTRHLGYDDRLLSAYVHEQLHWYLDQHLKQTQSAEAELRRVYPRVPVGFPDGAQDEESTYLHLVVCYLELQADRKLMGSDRASDVMAYWATDHYRWVYKTVTRDEPVIRRVVDREKLEID
jgi:hypothetical protein